MAGNVKSLFAFANFKTLMQPVARNVINTTCIRMVNQPCLLSSAQQQRGVRQVILHKQVIQRSRKEQQEWNTEAEQLGISHRQRLDKTLKDERQPSQVAINTNLEDMPLETMLNPYEKASRKCIICEHNISLDYKNVRLLSQFVSPYTGQIYGRQVTGLCQFMQRRISKLIKRSRYFGFMPYQMKEPQYLSDPKLCDPFKRRR